MATSPTTLVFLGARVLVAALAEGTGVFSGSVGASILAEADLADLGVFLGSDFLTALVSEFEDLGARRLAALFGGALRIFGFKQRLLCWLCHMHGEMGGGSRRSAALLLRLGKGAFPATSSQRPSNFQGVESLPGLLGKRGNARLLVIISAHLAIRGPGFHNGPSTFRSI